MIITIIIIIIIIAIAIIITINNNNFPETRKYWINDQRGIV